MTTQRSTRPDPFVTLAALRPDTSGRAWGAVEQVAARERVMSAPAQTVTSERRAGGRRRRVAAIALSGALVVGGASAAAAAGGLLPQSFTDVFSGWSRTSQGAGPELDGPGVDPSTARRVASAPGPDGTAFTLVSARAAADPAYRCTAVLFESPQSVEKPLPSVFQGSYGNGCGEVVREDFGVNGVTTNPGTGTWTWSASTGNAVRATLVGPDGTSYPVVSDAGTFYGWFPATPDDRPPFVLTGYGEDGSEVGRYDFSGTTG